MIPLEPEKGKDVYGENENIYKNNIDFDESYDVDPETIEINEEPDTSLKREKENGEEEGLLEGNEKIQKDNVEKQAKDEKKSKPFVVPAKKIKKPIKPIKKRKVKIVKKSEKSIKKDKSKNSGSSSWPWIVLIVVVVAAIAVLIWSIVTQTPESRNKENAAPSTVIATINGEELTLGYINKIYDSLDSYYQQVYTKEMILNQTIDETIMLQEAKKEGIEVTDKDVDEFIGSLLEEYSMQYSDFEESVQKQGLTMDFVKEAYRKSMIIERLLNEIVFNVIEVTPQEIEQYYNEKIEFFTDPANVKVKHVLIAIDENTTEERAKELITEVKNNYNRGEDFCKLVNEYSDDLGSKSNCGEYTFPKGYMVPEFERLSFELEPGKTGITQSMYGFHFILKIEDMPENVVPLEKLTDQINKTIKYEKTEETYSAYIKGLRAKSDIWVDYGLLNAKFVGDDANQATGSAVADAGEGNLFDELETVVQEPESADKEINGAGLSDLSDESLIDKDPAGEEHSGIIADKSALSKCLEDSEATLYGAYWKKEVKDQKEKLNSILGSVIYIECDSNHPDGNKEACEAEGITNYPTWIISNKKIEGVKSLEELQEIAC